MCGRTLLTAKTKTVYKKQYFEITSDEQFDNESIQKRVFEI